MPNLNRTRFDVEFKFLKIRHDVNVWLIEK